FIGQRPQMQPYVTIRLIQITLFEFLDDHIPLHIEAFFRKGQTKHAVGLKPESRFQIHGRHLNVIIGEIVGGKGIVLPSHPLQGFIVGRDIHRAAEHQVFEQMGKARPLGIFVPGADIVQYIQHRHGGSRIFMHQHLQSIVQCKTFKMYHIGKNRIFIFADMETAKLLDRALNLEFLSVEEGMWLYHHAPTAELVYTGHALRNIHKKNSPNVTWIIDRNLNTTNVCIANCKFCNFFRRPGHEESYITDIETYKRKIDETIRYGGEQLLLQGGHHPQLGLRFYTDLFRELKQLYPQIKLHALGPPEVAHIAKLDGLTHTEVLRELKAAGLDSLPGAGAGILTDRVRRLISKGKCSGREWLDVIPAAHQLHITSSATMMFGHVETIDERFEHLVWLREVQAEKPADAKGFIAFIPWPFQDDGTLLRRIRGIRNTVTGDEYIRMIALSRIMLPDRKSVV